MTAEAAISPPEIQVKSRFLDSPLVWLSALFLLGLFVPLIPVPSRLAALGASIILTTLYVVAVVLFVVHLTRLRLPWPYLLGALLLSLAIWATSNWITKPWLETIMHAQFLAHNSPSPVWRMIGLINFNARSLCILCAGVVGGALIAQIIRTPNMLGPVCAIVALIDIWGVLFGGIVAKLMANPATQNKVATLIAGMPTPGAASTFAPGYVIPQPAIGIGDFLFLGLLFGALHLNDMNWRGAAKWVIPLMILALIAVTFGIPGMLFGVDALPGLLFIGLGVAIPNLSYFQYTREERFALLYAGIFVVALTAALYFIVVSRLPADPHPRPMRGSTAPARP